jgi:heterodisulfide reductase subunit C
MDLVNQVIETGSHIFPKEDLKNFVLCIQCGKCVGGCPSGRRTAWRIRKTFRETLLGLKDKVFSDENLWNCTTCYTCQERCPRDVHTTDIVRILRNLAVRNGNMKSNHKKVCQIFFKYGHAVPLNEKISKTRKDLGLAEFPPTVQNYSEGLKEVMDLVDKTGFRKMVEEIEN